MNNRGPRMEPWETPKMTAGWFGMGTSKADIVGSFGEIWGEPDKNIVGETNEEPLVLHTFCESLVYMHF